MHRDEFSNNGVPIQNITCKGWIDIKQTDWRDEKQSYRQPDKLVNEQ